MTLLAPLLAAVAVGFVTAPRAATRTTRGPRRTVAVMVTIGVWSIGGVFAVGAALGLLVWWRRRPRRPERPADPSRPLVATIDLLALAVSSGCTPQQAIREVAAVMRPDAGPLQQAVRELDAGDSFHQVVDRLRVVWGPAGAPLVSALLAASEFGLELGPALALVAHDARLAERRRAEIHARRVPIRLLFPLVVCVLPAFALLTIVPLLLSTVHRLGT